MTAERALLARLEAGCAAPVGALAEIVDDVDGPVVSLRAVVGALDGSVELRRSLTGPVSDAAAVGRTLAETFLAEGADEIAPLRPTSSPSASAPTTSSPESAQ